MLLLYLLLFDPAPINILHLIQSLENWVEVFHGDWQDTCIDHIWEIFKQETEVPCVPVD